MNKMSGKQKKYYLSTKKKYCLLQSSASEKIYKNLHKNKDFLKCVTHLQQSHAQNFSIDTANFQVTVTNTDELIHIIRQMNDLYFLHYSINENVFYISVTRVNKNRYLNIDEKFSIEFKNNKKTLIKYGLVNQNSSITTDYKLKCNIESLKNIIGDTKTISITVTIDKLVTCGKCETVVQRCYAKLIRRSIWNCLHCAKKERHCSNNFRGCMYSNIPNKIKKHELFFCLFSQVCYICYLNVRNRLEYIVGLGLIPHYQDAHKDIIHPAGMEFLIYTSQGAYFFVDYMDQLLLCRYHLNSQGFGLAVRSQWQLEQLEQHKCLVTISFSTLTATLEMRRCDNSFNDWELYVCSSLYKIWPQKITISIVIERV